MVNKYSERRGQNKTNTFVFYAEPPPILLKYSERRGQWEKISLIIFFHKAEAPPVLSKDSARRVQMQIMLV